MKEYLVTWGIEIMAGSPEEAAREALKIHRDPESIATVFKVWHKGVCTKVNLTELDQAEENPLK